MTPVARYSASKAAADLLALAYHRTYGLPVIITRCSNNYGPYQFPEKLIPLMITNAIDASKIMVELGWQPKYMFDQGLKETVKWYIDNQQWWQKIKSGEYREYYKKMYGYTMKSRD